MSGLLKKSQDNANLKSRLSKDPMSRPSSAAAAEHINDKTQGGKPVELPAPIRKKTTETTNSSVVDPNYSPHSKRFRTNDGKLLPVADASFFDDSSSEEEAESPVIQRASSIRVAKPVLVRHVSNAANAVEHSASLRKENDRPKTPEPKDGPSDALRALESNGVKPLPSPPSTSYGQATIISTLGGDITASPASTVFSNMHTDSSSTSNSTPPSTPPITITTPLSPLSALRSNPITPSTELASVRLSRALSAPTPPNRNPNRRVTIRPSDLVISHTDNDHRLFRKSIITTPYPGSGGEIQSKKNRLSDIPDAVSRGNSVDVSDVDRKAQIQVFYPQTMVAVSPHEVGDRDRFPSLTSSESLFITLGLSSQPNSDSVLEITIPRTILRPDLHSPCSSKPRRNRLSQLANTGAVIEDFDDCKLFTLIRDHYQSKLIGSRARQWFLVPLRRLSSVDCVNDSFLDDVPHLSDPSGFLAHLQNPQLGKHKTGWLLWLRNCQTAPSQSPSRDQHERASNLFSAATGNSLLQTPVAGSASGVNNDGKGSSTAQQSSTKHNGIDSYLSSPTETSKSRISQPISPYPRMPFQQPLSPTRPASLHARIANNKQQAHAPRGPHIMLSHRTNLHTASLASLLVLFLGVLVLVLWVLFGVPGLAAGQRRSHGGLIAVSDSTTSLAEMGGVNGTAVVDIDPRFLTTYGSWEADAQLRVLTGMIMGAVVWFMGAVGIVLWWLLGRAVL